MSRKSFLGLDSLNELEIEFNKELELFLQEESNHNLEFATSLEQSNLLDNSISQKREIESDNEGEEFPNDNVNMLAEEYNAQKLKFDAYVEKNNSLTLINIDLQNKLNELTIQYNNLINNNNHNIHNTSIKTNDNSSSNTTNDNNSNSNNTIINKELEYQLAEARNKLSCLQHTLDDTLLAREVVEKELLHERVQRMHAEKGLFMGYTVTLYIQSLLNNYYNTMYNDNITAVIFCVLFLERDAYSAAYEASLKHFERWSQRKQLNRGLSPRSANPTPRGTGGAS